ncbi:MAG: M13 family peptidase, partial [Steroidobacteraceae bacterium]
MRFRIRRLVTLALALAATVVAAGTAHPPGDMLSGMDRSVRPGDDFFRYANGEWLRATRIPSDRSSWGTFGMLRELTAERTAALIRQAGRNSHAPAETRKVADYYATFMDEATIERKGLAPLEPALDAIAAIADRRQLASELGAALRADVDVLNNTQLHTANLFGLWVAADLDQPTQYIPILLQGGLEMPDRDYYLDPSAHMAAIRTQYRAHIARVLRLAHIADADAKAARIFELERRMARVHWSRADSEQVRKADNHWSRADFDRRAPGLDWQAFFAAAHLEHAPRFIVWQPSALIGLSAL